MIFTIIIPVYNVAPYLRECLDSVLAQAYTDWEAICVDDGSTDGSGTILDEYAGRDSRFKVIHKSNAGVSAARNEALDVARGDYVLFVDGDDALNRGTLEWYSNALKLYPLAQGLIFDAYIEGVQYPESWPELPDINKIKNKSIRDVESASMSCRTSTSWVFVREIINDLRFDTRYTLSEDSLFAQMYWWKISNWIIINDATFYFYRQRQGSAVNGIFTLEKVKGSLEANIKIAKMYLYNKDKWEERNLRSFFKNSAWSAWYTTRNMFFRLPINDMQKCFDLWLELQLVWRQLAGPMKLNREIAFLLFRITRSASICKILYNYTVKS